MNWTLLFLLMFAVGDIIWTLPKPILFEVELNLPFTPNFIMIGLGILVNSIAIIPALCGIRKVFFSRLMVVSFIYCWGVILMRIVFQLMPDPIVENQEDDWSGLFTGLFLLAFFYIYSATAAVSLLILEFVGRKKPMLHLEEQRYWSSHLGTIWKVCTFSSVVAVLIVTFFNGWQIRS
ncbi:MAG: hypothetical protein NT027_20370 [Proteobacteria bacterium]|nr:hypothetical protein [Pseudomonadota bacterium]